jgi:hypothetical protein
MKKIYILLLLFTITLFYSIPTEAYSLDANDIPITQLGGLTLNEVFKDNNLLINPDFNNGGTNWVSNNSTSTYLNGIATVLATAFLGGISQYDTPVASNIYYMNSSIYSPNDSLIVQYTDNIASDIRFNVSPNIDYLFYSAIGPITLNGGLNSGVYLLNTGSIPFSNVFIDYINIYNLTNLSLTSLTKNELDYYFNLWTLNNVYIQGELDGYASGLQDNTAYVQGYNVGYTDGLVEGTDMETGSSLLILIVALIGFVMMIFGFTTKRGIFNLLSVGAFVVLGTLLVEFVGFVIIAIGLVLINIYYAFFGEL